MVIYIFKVIICKNINKVLIYEIMNEVIRIALSGNMTAMKIEVFIAMLNGKEGKNMLALKERIDAEFRGHRESRRREGKLETAKNMLRENIDIDIIERVTGLKREQFM